MHTITKKVDPDQLDVSELTCCLCACVSWVPSTPRRVNLAWYLSGIYERKGKTNLRENPKGCINSYDPANRRTSHKYVPLKVLLTEHRNKFNSQSMLEAEFSQILPLIIFQHLTQLNRYFIYCLQHTHMVHFEEWMVIIIQ